MSNDGERKRNSEQIAAFVSKLYGDVASMSDAEVNDLFNEIAPDTDASAKFYELAEEVARRFRREQHLPPPHVQAVLDATKTVQDLDTAKPARLLDVIKQALTPSLGPAAEASVAYHNKTELTEKDKAILEELADELKDDWNEPLE